MHPIFPLMYCFIHFDQVPYFIAPDPRSLPSIPENVSMEDSGFISDILQNRWGLVQNMLPIQTDMCVRLCVFVCLCVRVSVGLPEELDGADCSSRCGKPAPALCQYAI